MPLALARIGEKQIMRTLRASNIRANSISATDIVLQGGCVVDYVHCNGTLRYDATCRIKKIEGDCIQKRM